MSAIEAMRLALALLPLVKEGVGEFVAWIKALRSSLQQSGEWTEEQERAYRAALWARTGNPAYQPDPA